MGYSFRQTSPLLLQSQPQLVWGLIASLFIGNVMLLVLNLPLIAVWVKCSRHGTVFRSRRSCLLGMSVSRRSGLYLKTGAFKASRSQRPPGLYAERP
jgi:hypothetical protein